MDDLNLRLWSEPYIPDLNLDPYSLPFLLQEMLQWVNRNSLFGFFPWCASQMKVVAKYASTVDVDPDLAVRVYAKLGAVEGCCGGFHFFVETVNGALQELGELFRVPKLHQVKDNNTLTPSQLVAGFITFLLELLDAHLSPSVLLHEFPIMKDVQSSFSVLFYQFPIVKDVHSSSSDWFRQFPILKDRVSELKFLVAPFEATEHEQVQTILPEFEQVANEAGALLHLFIFSPHHSAIDEAIKAFTGHINLLSSNIVKFLQSLPSSSISLPKRNDTRDCLFIVRNLIRDLMDRVTRDGNDDATMDDSEDVQDQEDIKKAWDLTKIVDDDGSADVENVEYNADLQMLYVRLRLVLPFMKGFNGPQHLETEFNQLLLQIRDNGCEAEYLIKNDVPLWYRTIRLIHVTSSLVRIGSRLHEMKTVHDVGTLKVVLDCSAQPSLKMEDYGHNDIRVKLEDVEGNILHQLVRGGNQLQIVTIFGMPGIGKTTLAKELYNKEFITGHFDRRAWITVSQTYQRKNLLIEILNCLEGHSGKTKTMNTEDDESLVLKIYQILKGRRYLVVLDDLWDLHSWEDLQTCFPDDGNGSRVLFTSRYKNVAPSGTIKNELPLLSDDQCWELLKEKVFHGEVCPPHLEEIGKEIAKKCRGLPLTTVVVAGVLSKIDRGKHAWENVGESLKSHVLSDQGNSTMQILEFSYKHLPKHLKQCFLYLGIFREDEQIYTRNLKWLWIAEGFIPEDDAEARAEGLAEKYLMELIDKSLVIVAEKRSDGGAKVCIVHDLLRELCLRIAKREKFRKVVDDGNNVKWALQLSRKRVPGNGYVNFSHLAPFDEWRSDIGYCVGKMEEFSAMNERNCWVKMISSNGIGVPIQGMILNSIHVFENLEFLILHDWDNCTISSNNLKKMVKLKYIRIEYELSIDGDWDTFQTTNLEYLSFVVIQEPSHIEILRCSPHLRTLKCTNLENWCIDLHFLTQLQSLSLSCIPYFGEIKLPSTIKKLNLCWSVLSRENISVIGLLPNLESLKLEEIEFEGERWDTSDGQFQKLKFLIMSELHLVQWNVTSNQHFPKLQQLILWGCGMLEEIPSEVGDIDTLQLIEIRDDIGDVAESGRNIKQEQEDMGNEQLKVIIY